MLKRRKMEYPECLNGRCTYNEEYRCKAEGISEDIICQMGKDDAFCALQDNSCHTVKAEAQNEKITDIEN